MSFHPGFPMPMPQTLGPYPPPPLSMGPPPSMGPYPGPPMSTPMGMHQPFMAPAPMTFGPGMVDQRQVLRNRVKGTFGRSPNQATPSDFGPGTPQSMRPSGNMNGWSPSGNMNGQKPHALNTLKYEDFDPTATIPTYGAGSKGSSSGTCYKCGAPVNSPFCGQCGTPQRQSSNAFMRESPGQTVADIATINQTINPTTYAGGDWEQHQTRKLSLQSSVSQRSHHSHVTLASHATPISVARISDMDDVSSICSRSSRRIPDDDLPTLPRLGQSGTQAPTMAQTGGQLTQTYRQPDKGWGATFTSDQSFAFFGDGIPSVDAIYKQDMWHAPTWQSPGAVGEWRMKNTMGGPFMPVPRKWAKPRFMKVILHRLWPYLRKYINVTLEEMLPTMLNSYVSSAAPRLELVEADIGTQPPDLNGIQVFDVKHDFILMDLDFSWQSDLLFSVDGDLLVGENPIDNVLISVENIKMKGVFRVKLYPLCDDFTLAKAAGVQLLETPELDFELNFIKRGGGGANLTMVDYMPDSILDITRTEMSLDLRITMPYYAVPMVDEKQLPAGWQQKFYSKATVPLAMGIRISGNMPSIKISISGRTGVSIPKPMSNMLHGTPNVAPSQWETCPWFSALLSQMWPAITKYKQGMIHDMIKDMCKTSKPEGLKTLSCPQFKLDPKPPVVRAAACNTDRENWFNLDLDVHYETLYTMKFVMTGSIGGLSIPSSSVVKLHLQLGMKQRLRMGPMIDGPPMVENVEIEMLCTPQVHLRVDVGDAFGSLKLNNLVKGMLPKLESAIRMELMLGMTVRVPEMLFPLMDETKDVKSKRSENRLALWDPMAPFGGGHVNERMHRNHALSMRAKPTDPEVNVDRLDLDLQLKGDIPGNVEVNITPPGVPPGPIPCPHGPQRTDWAHPGKWFTNMMDLLWPSIQGYTNEFMKENAAGFIDPVKPSWLSDLEMTHFDIGDVGFEYKSIRVLPQSDAGVIQFDVDIAWEGRTRIEIFADGKLVPKVHVVIPWVTMGGKLRIKMAPMLGEVPLVGAMGIQALGDLGIKFKADVVAGPARFNAGEAPFGPMIEQAISDSVYSMMTFPNWMAFPIALPKQLPSKWMEKHFKPICHSILLVTLMNGDNLPRCDMVFGADPYVKMWVGVQFYGFSAQKSATKKRTLKPKWYETFAIPIYNPTVEHLWIEMWDADTGPNPDDLMGKGSHTLSHLQPGMPHVSQIMLTDSPKNHEGGVLHVTLECVPIEPSSKERAEQVGKRILKARPKARTPDHYEPEAYGEEGWRRRREFEARGKDDEDGGKKKKCSIM